MKKFLILLFIIVSFSSIFPIQVHAQAVVDPCPTVDTTKAQPLEASDPGSIAILGGGDKKGQGSWQCDAEVTYTGKNAARARDSLAWMLTNYSWSNIQAGQPSPFDTLWTFIRNVVYAILGLFVLIAAFLMIITRGRSITVRRFVIRFLFVAVFVWFSFSIVRTIYYFTDIIQGFFIVINGKAISPLDLLSVSFDYNDFVGYRQVGQQFDEAAITSLLLVKATSATYFTMIFMLIIRKLILWGFILVSPVFPLLLFFKPVRNTAKIWVGEFFRWLLYAPLFAIFLRGLVEIWHASIAGTSTGIPLNFDLNAATINDPTKFYYPTAINILLGGPSQILSQNSKFSDVNLPSTFMLYIVALLMLWVVIILPWILLRIFLDYFNQATSGDGNLMKFLARNTGPLAPLINRYRGPFSPSPQGPVPPPLVPPPGSAGMARALPISRLKHSAITEIQTNMQQTAAQQQASTSASMESLAKTTQSAIAGIGSNISNSSQSNFSNQSTGQLFSAGPLKITDLEGGQVTASILGLSDLSIPTIKDIAKYEASMMSGSGNAELSKITETLNRLSGSSPIASPQEKEHFAQVRTKLMEESSKGNAVASSVVAAAKPGVATGALPVDNRVQQVNLEDYEEVKKTWQENYKKLEPPVGPDGQSMKRSVWLKKEVAQIPQVIDLLLSEDVSKQEQGKQMVSKILPFLLLGGFTKAEIVAYLKAKYEAAKQVLNEVLQVEAKQEDEENKIEVNQTGHAQAAAHMAAEIDPSEETDNAPADPNKVNS